jgi:signal transduction histidine kinase
MRLRHQKTNLDSSWPILALLLLAVLAPTACVLWFMNEAINNQREAARRKLAEAYRGQLVLVRDRIDALWEKRANELDQHAKSAPAPAAFAQIVRENLADAVILLDENGAGAYPSAQLPPEPDATARQAQAEIRTLVQLGRKHEAVLAIGRTFPGPPRNAIAADEQLLSLQLQPPGDPRPLASALNDYSHLTLPSAQRLFLMEELRPYHCDFPTYDAERLAARFLEAERVHPGDAILRQSALPQIWKITSATGRAIALYRTATVLRILSAQHLSFTPIPPGATVPANEERIPGGPRLPGWQIALNNTPASDLASYSAWRPQMTAYVWVGFLAIAVMTLLALAIGQAFRRQMRLARLKTDLVATVSHELKTPIASIRLLVDVLLDEDRFEPSKTREYLELIAKENIRLTRVIDNFLTFSRMERNRHKFEFVDTTPDAIVHAAMEAVADRFHSADCQLNVEVNPDLDHLRADPDAMVTVLLNLLDNAYKFTPAEKRIGLRAYRENGHICFSVEDNGIGIDSREQKKIFRKFYQVDRRLARQAGGCGLGLNIVEFIVNAHAGCVDVDSRPGTGSRFTVSLPCAANGARS